MLTSEALKQVLRYESETGLFVRLRTGTVAGAFDSRGYRQIQIGRKLFLAHRLAWLYMTGEWPAGHIDHIDHRPHNNAFCNLRVVSRAGNMQNKVQRQKNNRSSRFLGVFKTPSGWAASISTDGVKRHLGTFPSEEMAHSVYVKAKRYFHSTCTL